MVAILREHRCIYCGKVTKKTRKGEHVIPKAIGGTVTLNKYDRVVCKDCNNKVLSTLDKELCRRSYLSVVASQQLDSHLWQVWDVDHESNNQLVEAKPLWSADEELNCLQCYPQITFERTGPEVRGDYLEFCNFGNENYLRVLYKAIQSSFYRYCSGEKGGLHFERVRSSSIRSEYRLAPRIYTSHSISEIARDIEQQSFTIRYLSNSDKRFALNALSKLQPLHCYSKVSHKTGSAKPAICFYFDIEVTIRAIMKLGLNLIAAVCSNTPVNELYNEPESYFCCKFW
jgi:hypothetical protein